MVLRGIWALPRAVVCAIAVAALCFAQPADADEAEVDVMAVLDRYMAAVNALDRDAHLSTYHFPHFRFAGGRIVIWESADDFPAFRPGQMLAPDWHRSVWAHREIVQRSPEKVHVATRFSRLRRDGSEIVSYDSLYVLTKRGGQWGIQGRSSFAP